MIVVWFTSCNMNKDPTAREVELGPVHPVKIWTHPVGLCRMSDRNTLIKAGQKLAASYLC
jgi:hypothetical protein